jgi:hypothetical protein
MRENFISVVFPLFFRPPKFPLGFEFLEAGSLPPLAELLAGVSGDNFIHALKSRHGRRPANLGGLGIRKLQCQLVSRKSSYLRSSAFQLSL